MKQWETIKLEADVRSEDTLKELLRKDKNYIESREQLKLAEEWYSLLDLTPRQRAVCDSILSVYDEQMIDLAANAYIAGVIDARIRNNDYFA